MRLSSFARFSALGIVVGLAFGVSSARAEDPKPDSDTVELLVKEETPLLELVRAASTAADVTIVWSDQDKGLAARKLVGARRLVVPKSEVLDTVRALLASDEVVLVPIDSGRRRSYVAMDARMLQNQVILKANPEHVEMDDESAERLKGQTGLFVEAVIRVPWAESPGDMRDLRAAMQRIVTQQNVGTVQEVPSARALVVTDFAPNVAAIYRLTKTMAERYEQKAEFFTLQYAKADAVELILEELLVTRTPVPGVPANPESGRSATAATTRVDGPRIVADPRTNQVVVLGTPTQLQLAREIVHHLDVQSKSADVR